MDVNRLFEENKKDPRTSKRPKNEKKETNVFVTISSNKKIPYNERDGKAMIGKWEALMQTLFSEEVCDLFEFREGCIDDIIKCKVKVESEIGDDPKGKRLHTHAMIQTEHRCNIRLDIGKIRQLIKMALPSWYPGNKYPYVQVKLLPSTDWLQKIEEYIDK